MLSLIKYIPLALDPKNLQRAFDDLRLVHSLMWDSRVPLHAKAIPGLGTFYILTPFDLIPSWIPILGQIDDLAVMILAVQLFKRAVPPELLAEHEQRLGLGAPQAAEA
jgi:uncharacterized membrane protein YkvA (DUF1232 family)